MKTDRKIQVTITKKVYGWSKHGGAMQGMSKELLDEWYCQACRQKQTKNLPGYMIALDDREYMRICTTCKHTALVNNIDNYHVLMRLLENPNKL